MASTADLEQEKKIICAGLVCVDIVSTCKKFPEEDSDQMCLDQRWQRGGNASNSCTVLAQLGARTEFIGTMARSHELSFLQSDFSSHNIEMTNCRYHDNHSCPLSIVIINDTNGSRTIIHANKGLPELTLQDFKVLNLEECKWVHFECRHSEIPEMVDHVTQHNRGTRTGPVVTSLELEKTHAYTLDMMKCAVNYLFVSKDLAQHCGARSKEEAPGVLKGRCHPSATIIVAWGDKGAIARSPDGAVVQCPAFPPPGQLVDTLAAGDTFNAATILALSRGKSLEEAVRLGCLVAGTKCGLRGLQGLGAAVRHMVQW